MSWRMKVEGYLATKNDCRFIDIWEMVGDAYYDLGDMDKAVEAYKTYLDIAPNMVPNLRKNAEKGTFPKELAAALGILD